MLWPQGSVMFGNEACNIQLSCTDEILGLKFVTLTRMSWNPVLACGDSLGDFLSSSKLAGYERLKCAGSIRLATSSSGQLLMCNVDSNTLLIVLLASDQCDKLSKEHSYSSESCQEVIALICIRISQWEKRNGCAFLSFLGAGWLVSTK